MSIYLTPEEQTTLTIALALENEGFTSAAQWLRNQIAALKGVKWDEPPHPGGWEAVFRTHRGSLPPVVTPTPTAHQPAIRPDQIVGAPFDEAL